MQRYRIGRHRVVTKKGEKRVVVDKKATCGRKKGADFQLSAPSVYMNMGDRAMSDAVEHCANEVVNGSLVIG